MVDLNLETAALRLKSTMCEIWPTLEDIKLTHVWTGNTGYSFTHMPSVGEHNGLHYAMGFSGSGTVMAPYLGAKAALRALEHPDGATAYANTKLRSRWFHRGQKPWFLYLADFWYRNWVDAKEHRAARG
jgi:glycine/D-amino acid oxidase-like deaminating enzyme